MIFPLEKLRFFQWKNYNFSSGKITIFPVEKLPREHTPNEREINWIKVEVSPLSFLGGEEGERGERQKDKSNSMSVQRSKQLLKSL